MWAKKLYLYVTWCHRFGKITSWSRSARTAHGLFCRNVNPPVTAKTAGGIGETFVEVQAWVEVECASIPTGWPKYHATLMMRIRYFGNGVFARVAYS